MKKRITCILLFAAIIVSSLSLSSCGNNVSKNPTRPDNIPEADTSAYDLESDVYRTVAETDNVKFEFNDLTTDIRITNKKTGYSWSTEYNDMGTVTRGEIFSLDYYTTTGTMISMLSSDNSIAKGQFKISDTKNGVSVQYGLGDINFVIDFPLAVSVERKNKFMEKMTEDQKAIFDDNYTLYDFSDPKYQDKDQYDDAKLAEEKKNHPLAASSKNGWYYMTSTLTDKTVDELHDFWITQLKYTESDLKKDSEGVKATEIDRPEFNIQIDYTLEGDNLKVNIPESKIYYAKDYTIEKIQLHPDLLDFETDTSGYYLLPDGSGSLLNFNNGRDELRNDAIYVQMYGIDDARGIDEKTAYYNNAILPVYGCCVRGKSKNTTSVDDTGTKLATSPLTELANEKDTSKYNGLFATITSGESFAGIEAHSGSATESTHNRAFTEFRINECQKMKSFSTSSDNDETYSKYQFQRYLGDMTVVYHLLDGDNATYSGMANYYSEQLFGNSKTEKKDYYSTVETMGVINGNGLFMGISYNKKIPLTTFEQTKTIAEDLKKNGFNNMNIKLSGWCNGGYEHGYLNKIKVSSELGGKDSFTSLIDSLSKDNIGLYPDVDYQYVYANEKVANRNDNSSSINGSRNILTSIYNPITFQLTFTMPRYALTVPAMQKNLDNFMNSYSSYNIKNLSLRSIGDKITANFREEDFCERQETLENLVKQVSGVKEKQYNIMGTTGDAPFLKYLSYVNKLPIVSAGYDKSDYSVPFTAMVLSGHVQYTGDTINLSNNDRLDLLQMIEAGAGAYYTLTGDQYDDISYTGSQDLYSTKYDNIKDSVLNTYKYLSGALSDVYGLSITKHKILADGVNMVTYENGVSIVVNYNDSDYSASGITCKAKDYAVIKGA